MEICGKTKKNIISSLLKGKAYHFCTNASSLFVMPYLFILTNIQYLLACGKGMKIQGRKLPINLLLELEKESSLRCKFYPTYGWSSQFSRLLLLTVLFQFHGKFGFLILALKFIKDFEKDFSLFLFYGLQKCETVKFIFISV